MCSDFIDNSSLQTNPLKKVSFDSSSHVFTLLYIKSGCQTISLRGTMKSLWGAKKSSSGSYEIPSVSNEFPSGSYEFPSGSYEFPSGSYIARSRMPSVPSGSYKNCTPSGASKQSNNRGN